MSLCMSPVTSNLATAYEVPQLEVNMCGIIFAATFVPMTFISMWMYKVFKTHTVLRVALLLILVGGWVRTLVPLYGFWTVLLG